MRYENKRVKSNVKATWKTVNDILIKVREKMQCDFIEQNGKQIPDKQAIVQAFNNFFSTIGRDTVNSIPDASVDFLHFFYLKGTSQSLYL